MERHTIRKAVVDACVLVKWFAEEPDSDKAAELRDMLFSDEIFLIAPDLAVYEVANALHFTHREKQDRIETITEMLFNSGIDFIRLRQELVALAAVASEEHHLSIYDAAYAALAIQNRVPLITCDSKIIKALPKWCVELRNI